MQASISLAALLKISDVSVVDVCVELILALGEVVASVLFEASQFRPQMGEIVILVLLFKL
jgi:DNA-directed RNA polymerase subunit E'/Rpb7